MTKPFRKGIIATILAGLLINTGAPIVSNATDLIVEEKTAEVVVVYKNDKGKQKVLEKAIKVIDSFGTLKAINVVLSESALNLLAKDTGISYIERKIEKEVKLLGTPGQWNVEAINAPKAWEQGFTGQGVKVAIIDTGIAQHEELPNVVKRVSFVEDDPATAINESSTLDHNGHGTHVAGIVGAKMGGPELFERDIVGVAPNVSLYSLKVMDEDSGTVLDLIEAIDWAIANNMDIINLSLGLTTHVQLLQDAVDRANRAGILVVAAAGNDGNGSSVNYPAKYNSVIAVSSVDWDKVISSFSSTGIENEFTAPGSDFVSNMHIISTSPFLEKYTGMGGTSQAAPHVTGFLTLLMQKNPQKTASEIRMELRKYVDDLGVPGRDELYGYGLINYLSYDGTPPVVPTINPVADNMTNISGKTEPYAIVNLYTGGKYQKSTTADQNGSFNFAVEKQKAGTEIKVTATDNSGNVSGTSVVIVIDKTAPGMPILNPVTDQSTVVGGKTEPFSIVSFYISGKPQSTASADQYGNFSFKIFKQKAGTELKVTAADKAGNVSDAKAVIVLDKTAPAAPSLNPVADNATTIVGKTEAYATVSLYLAGKYHKITTADQYGNYRFTISKQRAGTEIKVIATDKARNVSGARIVRVLDKTAPFVPDLNQVADYSTVIAGKAEAFSIVNLYISGRYQKSATADKYGNFKFYIKRLAAGTEVMANATDRAGNRSGIRKVKVVDKTAPIMPSVNKVTRKSTYLSGKTEKYTAVHMYLGKKRIGSAAANSKGYFSFKIKQQKKGTQLYIYSVDKAGNKSKNRIVKVY
jgi:subtilisin family serine protease